MSLLAYVSEHVGEGCHRTRMLCFDPVLARPVCPGLIETGIQLFGPQNSVNHYCNIYTPARGVTDAEATLAYLETLGICNDWKASFSFWFIGTVFSLWMMVISFQVQQDDF